MKNEFKMSSTAAAVSSKKYHVVTEFYKTGRTRHETFECDRNFFNNMHNWIESLFVRVCETLKLHCPRNCFKGSWVKELMPTVYLSLRFYVKSK